MISLDTLKNETLKAHYMRATETERQLKEEEAKRLMLEKAK